METYINKIQKDIDMLVKRLGAKTQALIAQEPYKYLTGANYIQYTDLQKEIKQIEDKITSLESAIEYIEQKEKEYIEPEDNMDHDDHLGTGMDTSIDINQFETKEY